MRGTDSTVGATAPRSCTSAHVQQGDASRASLFVKTARIFVRGLFDFFFSVHLDGRENIPRGQAIICCNHLGWADAFSILCYLPVEPRIYALGYSIDNLKDEGARAFRGRVLDAVKVMVPLHPDRPVEAVRVTHDLLQRGGSLLIFPEGTLTGAEEGKLFELQPGAAHLSQMSDIPLLPIGLTGTKELWLRRNLTLRIGKPIYPGAFQGATRERVEAMTQHLEKALLSLIRPDNERPRAKLLRNWLTGLFPGEDHPVHSSRRRPT